MSAIQNYETDALQEHVDSTSILITRLDQWRVGVHAVEQFVQGYYQLSSGTAHHLEKMLKNVGDLPAFPSTGASSGSQLSHVFSNMQSSVNSLLQRSTATANSIKSTVLPPLEQVQTEIDKHYKALKNQGQKGIKEVEKSREATQKHIESLAQVTASFGSRNLSTHEDPYILHRRTEAAVSEQIARENTQAEAALNVQKTFSTLETHIVQTIRQSLAQLSSLTQGYDQHEVETTSILASAFKDIDMPAEWQAFTSANAEHLVPSSNYQRDPAHVTFTNKNHASAQPIVQGLLSRKGTVLKQYNQGYYVLSPAGFLYQFKSSEPTIDATPELSLFVPECEVNRSSKPGSFEFRVAGKDAQKTIKTRHKYMFRTNSQRELDIWYTAIAKMAGHVLNDEDDDSPSASPIDPPVYSHAQSQSPQPQSPRAQVTPTQVPQTQTQVPQVQVPQTQVPQTQVPQTQVPQVQVPQAQAGQTGAPSSQMGSLNLGTDPFRGF